MAKKKPEKRTPPDASVAANTDRLFRDLFVPAISYPTGASDFEVNAEEAAFAMLLAQEIAHGVWISDPRRDAAVLALGRELSATVLDICVMGCGESDLTRSEFIHDFIRYVHPLIDRYAQKGDL